MPIRCRVLILTGFLALSVGCAHQCGQSSQLRAVGEEPNPSAVDVRVINTTFKLGGREVSDTELAKLALNEVLARSKSRIKTVPVHGYVRILADDTVQVVLSQGLWKPSWTVILNSRLEVVEFKEQLARDRYGGQSLLEDKR